MRIESKKHLLEAIDETWQALMAAIAKFPTMHYETRICLPNSLRDESVKDILAHLLSWHHLFLGWYQSGKDGVPELPAPGFKWNQTPQLNQQIFEQWKETSFVSVKRRLAYSHNKIWGIAQSTSEQQLMSPGIFLWTGKLTLAKYLAPNTASHYKWAVTKIGKISKAFVVSPKS